MRRILAALGIALGAAATLGAVGACSGTRGVAQELDPTATLQAFYDALAAGDADAAASWVVVLDPARTEDVARSLAETIEFAASGALVLVALEARVDGDWALVVARHELAGEARLHGELARRTGGGWRIALGGAEGEEVDRLWEWFDARFGGGDARAPAEDPEDE